MQLLKKARFLLLRFKKIKDTGLKTKEYRNDEKRSGVRESLTVKIFVFTFFSPYFTFKSQPVTIDWVVALLYHNALLLSVFYHFDLGP